MVAGKKVHCAYCQKKCSGNVLRYQDQYYHKPCFELEQSELAASAKGSRLELYVDSVSSSTPLEAIGNTELAYNGQMVRQAGANDENLLKHNQQQQQQQRLANTSKQIFSTSKNNEDYHPIADNQRPLISSASTSSSIQNNNPANTNQQQQQQQQYHYYRQQMASETNNGSPSTNKKSQTIDARQRSQNQQPIRDSNNRSATLPHSISSPTNGFLQNGSSSNTVRQQPLTSCAGCGEKIRDGQALIALDLHWHVWCFKCTQCKSPLHGEYVAKDGRAYCERDYQKLFGITCVYCKRYITGKVLQAGEAHHFHPSCARCSKCGDPFVPGEEMYLQGEVTWHPRCGPGPEGSTIMSPGDEYDESSRSQLRASRAQSPSLSSRSRSRSASPFSFMSRQYGRHSPAYADSEAVGDLSRVYTISYLNADPTQGYLRRPIEPNPPKSPQFSRPTSSSRLASDRSRCSSRSNQPYSRERSIPRGMYSVLSSMRGGSSTRARSPSMMNEEAIHMAQYPSGQKPSPDSVPKIERDDFPAPPFPYHPDRSRGQSASAATSSIHQASRDTKGVVTGESESPVQYRQQQQQQQQRTSRPRSREIVIDDNGDSSSINDDPQFRKEEEELSKIANGIGKIFLQTLKEREKLRAWKRANLDPRNASRTPSATRELPSRLRYENPTNASPSRDLDRPRPWEEEDGLATGEQSPTRTRSSLGRPSQMSSANPMSSSSAYGYKVVQSNRSTPKPGYGLGNGSYVYSDQVSNGTGAAASDVSFAEQQQIAQNRSADLLGRANKGATLQSELGKTTSSSSARSLAAAAHLRRSMPNVANLHHIHQEGPPKLYPYHLLATSNYRLPPDVDRCHLERHLSNEEFQYIFHCDRLDFYRLPEWKRNELKRRAKLF